MRFFVGILCSAGWLLYVGQIISVVDFGLAQRLGLQEAQEHTDPLSSHLELWTARWDLLWLWTLPLAGVLMLLDHFLWPYAALVAGGTFVDAGGREAAKVLGLKNQGVRIGSPGQYRVAMSAYVYLTTSGVLAIVLGLLELT